MRRTVEVFRSSSRVQKKRSPVRIRSNWSRRAVAASGPRPQFPSRWSAIAQPGEKPLPLSARTPSANGKRETSIGDAVAPDNVWSRR